MEAAELLPDNAFKAALAANLAAETLMRLIDGADSVGSGE